jgi:hypothetical protein
MMRVFLVIFLWMFLFEPPVAGIFKCRSYDGDISYSEEPCPNDETEWGIKITEPKKRTREKESILSAIYSREMYATSVKTLGRCSAFHFKYPDNFNDDDQALRTSAIAALRKISGYYKMTEAEFTQMHNSSLLDAVDMELGQSETSMFRVNCNKQFQQILDFAKPERFVAPEN